MTTSFDSLRHLQERWHAAKFYGYRRGSFVSNEPLGYPDQALAIGENALRLANAMCHPFSQAHSQSYVSQLHLLRGEFAAAEELIEAMIALVSDQEFPQWQSFGAILKGWVLIERGLGPSS